MGIAKRLLKDAATIFAPLGENEDGVMQYETYVFENVFCRAGAGMTINGGQNPADTLDLYVFDTSSAVTVNGDERDVATSCEAIFDIIRNTPTDIDTAEKIYVLPYASKDSAPPPMSRRVSSVVRRAAGAKRLWHWEVHGK